MYAGAVLYLAGTALLLGSWYGLAATVIFIAGIVLRALLEERTLAAELPGYAAYMRKVRYRLVRRIW
jgi:protein-S-isoprenylcysteine O-methyltransferase Ste14